MWSHGSSWANYFGPPLLFCQWVLGLVETNSPVSVFGGIIYGQSIVPALRLAVQTWQRLQRKGFKKSDKDRAAKNSIPEEDEIETLKTNVEMHALAEEYINDLRTLQKNAEINVVEAGNGECTLQSKERAEFVQKLLFILFVTRSARPQTYFNSKIQHWMKRQTHDDGGCTWSIGPHKASRSANASAYVILPAELVPFVHFYVTSIRKYQFLNDDGEPDIAGFDKADAEGWYLLLFFLLGGDGDRLTVVMRFCLYVYSFVCRYKRPPLRSGRLLDQDSAQRV